MTIHAPTTESLNHAATLLRAGELVAIPTETVYGLAADATNADAVTRIYCTKSRPQFNPLISHYASLQAMQRDVVMDTRAHALAEAFWPGALTLVLSKPADSRLCSLTTAGLSTAAVRMPAHPVARQLLHMLDFPLAAPSANPSGRLSPTRAEHVQAMLGDQLALILDGGAAQAGVESTILDLTTPRATILRYGTITRAQLEAVIGTVAEPQNEGENTAPKAPGMLLRHYAPRTPLRLGAEQPIAGEALLGFGDISAVADHFAIVMNLSPSGDVAEASRHLFDYLHRLDAMQPTRIAVSPLPQEGLGLALWDRLQRAANASDNTQ